MTTLATLLLGPVLKDLGDLAGVRAAFERALAILEKVLPPYHPRIRIVQGHLEQVGERLGQFGM